MHARHGHSWELFNLHIIAILRASCYFSQANARQWCLHKYHMRQYCTLSPRIVTITKELTLDNTKVVERHIGILRPTINIAQCPDMWLGSLQMAINDNSAALVSLHPSSGKIKLTGIRPAASGHEHSIIYLFITATYHSNTLVCIAHLLYI